MSNTSRLSGDAESAARKGRRRGRPARNVLLEQVVDRDRALVLDVGAGAADRAFVERHRDEPVACLVGSRRASSPVEPDRDRAGVGVEALRPRRARSPPGRARASCSGAAFEDRGALHEVEHAEARREARRARGRQHVVGAGDIVADRLRRVRAEEDRAGIADFAGEPLGVGASRSRDARARARRPAAPRRRASRTRMIAPKSRHDAPATAPRGSVASCAVDRLLDRVGERRVVGDQDRLRARRRARPAPAGRRRSSRDCRSLSARISTSDGPAIMSMPTVPNTRRLAAAT